MIDNIEFDNDIWGENSHEENIVMKDFFETLWEVSVGGKQTIDEEMINNVLGDFREEETDGIIHDYFYDALREGERGYADLEKGYIDTYCERKIGTCTENGVPKDIYFAMNSAECPYFNWIEELDDFNFIFVDPSKPRDLDSNTINWIENEVKKLTPGAGGTLQLNDVLDILTKARG